MNSIELGAGVPIRQEAADLVARAIAGDLVAFEELVRVRLASTYRTACGILGEPMEAEDATQEAFVVAWQKLPSLRDVERFDAWLNRVLLNICRMRLRSRKSVRQITLDDGRGAAAHVSADTTSHVDEIDHVGRALDRLSADDRALLVLHHVNEEPLAEIATALGIPIGTVKWRLSRARAALEHELESQR